MATLTNPFSINGVISTDKTVLDNMQTLCTAAGAWLSYDIALGKWAVIINRSGSSIKSFDDSNILGGINVSGTGIKELYNKVSIQFPNKDIRDKIDYIDLSIPSADRFENELDNVLNMQLDCINDPVQAQYLATVELKQSRVDKIIEFRSDYTAISLKAGDLIDITNSALDYTNKIFRIITLQEEESDDGSIIVAITALEYDSDVYDTSDLVREERFDQTGITPLEQNSAITASNNTAQINDLASFLGNPLNALLLTSLLNALTKPDVFGSSVGLTPNIFTFRTNFQSIRTPLVNDYVSLGYQAQAPVTGYYKIKYNVNWGGGALGSAASVGGAYKISEIAYAVNGGNVILDVNSSTGDDGVPIFEDHIIEAFPIYLTQGDVIEFYFGYYTDWSTAVYLVNGEFQLIARA